MTTRTLYAPLLAVIWFLLAALAVAQMRSGVPAFDRMLSLAAFALLSLLVATSRRLAPSPQVPLSDIASDLTLAEEMAGFGRWSVDLVSGRHGWSPAFCKIAGLPPETPPDARLLERLLPDGLQQMHTTFHGHRHDRDGYVVEFEIENPKLGTRVLRARARNVFSPEGVAEHVLMVARDVTDEYTRVARIQQEKHDALREAAEARRIANTDVLTGLANRRSAMAALDRAVVASRLGGKPLGLIVFDIDHFKAINDTHGHATGDRVLAEIGRIAALQARDGQCAARIGGEEFLLILPGANETAAAGAAERLRLAVESGTAMAGIPAVTASIGHAMLGPSDTSLTLFARADAALYAAKKAGRNRVALAA
ncbi:GGDEF domain-containing protein [Qipengyuania sp. 6B39]|uniref:GGDEF domain-containing protein n=1 Tax=Qipengyuania proteolytica TaxID=2867239 RepID=UPI001C89511E|nr:sensor domain-containing diguanylate cyclase [Qipengyuania proteolytica]MBX7495448.1 GGDEF domain-containing protein [Qipengyuania proteolytica]